MNTRTLGTRGCTPIVNRPRVARVLLCVGTLTLWASAAGAGQRQVFVNAVQLSDETVTELEGQYRIRIADGRYWYDGLAGTWGLEGGPTLGFARPGQNVGGALRADASAGDTRVFVNGRELHRLEVRALQNLGPVLPGRYWADAFGNVGYEGGRAFINLFWVAQQHWAAGARLAGPWAQHGKYDTGFVGGDVNGCLYAQFGEHTHSNC